MLAPGTELATMSDTAISWAIVLLGVAFVAYTTATALEFTSRRAPERLPVGARRFVEASGELDPAEDPGGAARRWGDRAGRVANWVMVVAVALMCLAVALRGLAGGRAPWGNMYEFALTGSAAVGIVFLVFLWRWPIRAAGAGVAVMLLLWLGVAITSLYTPVDELVPVLDSIWLVVHVAAAIVAGALFTIGAIATVIRLVHSRRDPSEPEGIWAEVARTAHLVAFPIWTFAVMAGAIWAENAWGRYWGWDPKETWALITWVLYAAHLHALSTAGWRRRADLLALAGYLAFLFNFFGVNIWIPGLHSYAGV